MKRRFLPVMLLLAMSLTACGEAKTEDHVFTEVVPETTEATEESTLETKDAEGAELAATEQIDTGAAALYDDFLEQIKVGLTNGFEEPMIDGLAIGDVFMAGNDSDIPFGYMTKDLNGDGVDELILGQYAVSPDFKDSDWDGAIYDVYTIENGKMVQIVDGWARNVFHLLEDGTFENIGSGGAAYTAYSYYEVAGNELKLKESIFTDYIDDAQTETGWFRSETEAYADDAVEISDEDANKILNSVKYAKLDLKPILE